ncbi:MAG: Tn3 family transposase [Desulfovibrionaceae bacterium]|nr:Tn3 family transposase [Desulfovibrionaceae bacterium]
MATRGGEILTKEQRLEFTSLAGSISEEEIAAYYTLSSADIEIVNRHRRDHNRLGFALQLCMLRHPGWPLSIVKEIPARVLGYVAGQIGADPCTYQLYWQREATALEHMDEIRQQYGYKVFDKQMSMALSEILISGAMENGNSMHLINLAISVLRKNMVILPGMSTIESIVWESRKDAEEKIYGFINGCLADVQKTKLDELLTLKDGSKTKLAWLKEAPKNFSPESFLKIMERLECVRELGLEINRKNIHPNRLAQLSRMGEKYDAQALLRFGAQKRYAFLVIYLLDLSQNLVDYAVEIHDRQMMNLETKGRSQQNEIQKQNGKTLNEKVIIFSALVKALSKAKYEGADPYAAIELSVMPWDSLVASGQEAEKLARPIDYDYIDLIQGKYPVLRRYAPTLLKRLTFKAAQSSEPLIKAIELLNGLNDSNKRGVPKNTPTDFLPDRWKKYAVNSDGTINRRYYEIAVLEELKNSIRSGDISVEGSRKHRDFDEYLLSKEEWELAKSAGSTLAVSEIFEDFLIERQEALSRRIKWVNENLRGLDGVTLRDSEIHIKRLEKSTPDGAKEYSRSIYRLLPNVKLADLLMDVANWTGFLEQFSHASTGRLPGQDEKETLIITLIAMGTNIGLFKMGSSTDGISYNQMANAAQWRLYDDALSRAQSVLVNFLHRQPLSCYWGDGSASSSDGMRVVTAVPTLHGEHNPHYGSERGATIYRFVSDQYSSFYAKVI